jgi:protein-disulfide isomerase
LKKAKHKKNKKSSHVVEEKSSDKANLWLFTSVALAVLLIVSLVLGLTGAFNRGAEVSSNEVSSSMLTQGEAEAKAVEFVNLIGEIEGVPLTLNEVRKEQGIYFVDVAFMGQQNNFYMSLDGDLFFLQGISMSDIREIKAQMDLSNQQPPPGQQANDVTVNLEGANTLGSGDVLMVEYSSATCPFCARYNADTFPLINSEYIESGKITYVYKHFIRNDVDVLAANGMECAGEQGVFFEFKDLVYANQNSLSQQAVYSAWASELDLDVDAFDACFNEKRYSAKATADTGEGQGNGVTGTPGFLINSRLIAGAQPFANFQTAIEAELAI